MQDATNCRELINQGFVHYELAQKSLELHGALPQPLGTSWALVRQ